MHDESQRSQEAQREEGPSAWISGHIQCLQKERTRSHQPNPEAPGKRQAPLRRQVPTGFIFRSHSKQLRRWRGGRGLGRIQHRTGEGWQRRLRAGGAPGPHLVGALILQPRQGSDLGRVTERGWQKHSEDAGLPGWGPCKHMALLLPDGRDISPSSFRSPPPLSADPQHATIRKSPGFGARRPESPGFTLRLTHL